MLGVNEVHSFRLQLAPEERQWGGKLNLKGGGGAVPTGDRGTPTQTCSAVRRGVSWGTIWRQHYALHAALARPDSAERCGAAAPNMN